MGVIALVSLIAVLVGVWVERDASEFNRSDETLLHESLVAATNRITNESRGTPPPPVEAADIEVAIVSHPDAQNSPKLPIGYKVVGFSGEMTMSPIRDRDNQ